MFLLVKLSPSCEHNVHMTSTLWPKWKRTLTDRTWEHLCWTLYFIPKFLLWKCSISILDLKILCTYKCELLWASELQWRSKRGIRGLELGSATCEGCMWSQPSRVCLTRAIGCVLLTVSCLWITRVSTPQGYWFTEQSHRPRGNAGGQLATA